MGSLGYLTFTKTLEEILLLFSSILHPTPWSTFRELDSAGELDLRRKESYQLLSIQSLGYACPWFENYVV